MAQPTMPKAQQSLPAWPSWQPLRQRQAMRRPAQQMVKQQARQPMQRLARPAQRA
jgi:hypothetical protein